MGAAVHGERKRSQAARLSKTELAVVSDGIFLRLAFRGLQADLQFFARPNVVAQFNDQLPARLTFQENFSDHSPMAGFSDRVCRLR
jgi:hypothetical protein